MSLNDGLVLGQTVVDLAKGTWGIVLQPACFGEKHLSLCKCRILFGYVLEQLDCLNQVLGRALRGRLGLGATVHEVLLGELHEEVSVQLDVEVKVVVRGLGLLDMQVEGSIQHSNSLDLVATNSPFELGFQEGVLRALAFVLRLANGHDEVKLLLSILELLLLDAAVDHTVKGKEVVTIDRASFHVGVVSRFIVTFQTALVTNFGLIGGILWL